MVATGAAGADGWASRPYQRHAMARRRGTDGSKTCDSAKRTGLENAKLRTDVAGWQGVRMRRNNFSIRFVSVRNAHAHSHYPLGLETTRGGLAPSQGARLGNEMGRRERPLPRTTAICCQTTDSPRRFRQAQDNKCRGSGLAQGVVGGG